MYLVILALCVIMIGEQTLIGDQFNGNAIEVFCRIASVINKYNEHRCIKCQNGQLHKITQWAIQAIFKNVSTHSINFSDIKLSLLNRYGFCVALCVLLNIMCYNINSRVCKYQRMFRKFTNECMHLNPLAVSIMLIFKYANLCEIRLTF